MGVIRLINDKIETCKHKLFSNTNAIEHRTSNIYRTKNIQNHPITRNFSQNEQYWKKSTLINIEPQKLNIQYSRSNYIYH